jgi:hypothetical protein
MAGAVHFHLIGCRLRSKVGACTSTSSAHSPPFWWPELCTSTSLAAAFAARYLYRYTNSVKVPVLRIRIVPSRDVGFGSKQTGCPFPPSWLPGLCTSTSLGAACAARYILPSACSVPDPWHFGVDPESRILLFLSWTFKTPTKKLIFENSFSASYFLKVHLHHFSRIKSP